MGMIECIFTVDYEISGNGHGALTDYVLKPMADLKSLFDTANAKLVVFVEVSELEKIEEYRADTAISAVKAQIKDLYSEGHEIGLHIHPQWCHARFDRGSWLLDYSEYNLCILKRDRIEQIVSNAIGYLRRTLADSCFVPFSFRAGNWLFQPTAAVASVLADHGVRLDSSVYRGGWQRKMGLDYRKTPRSLWYWRFSNDVCVDEDDGIMVEIPIHTRMVPCWRLLTPKRLGLKHRGAAAKQTAVTRLARLTDFLRLWQPLKLDFCNMTAAELIDMIEQVMRADDRDPGTYRPVVAIGHTKDLADTASVETFLGSLAKHGIGVSTFADACRRMS